MNKLAFPILATFLLVAFSGIGQKYNYDSSMAGNTLKQIVKSAEDAMAVKDYYTAMIRYKRAREIKPKSVDYAYGYAEAARQALSFARAEEGYADVLEMRETGSYPLTQFWYANIKQLLGSYTEAIDLYQAFISAEEGNEDVPTYYLQRARKEIADSEWSRDIAEEQHNVEVNHIGDEINTPNKEFGAFIVGDTLFYSSLSYESRKDDQPTERAYSRIMYSVNGETGMQLMGEVNDTTRHTANLAYNAEKNIKVFTRCEYQGERSVIIQCRIYVQRLNEDGSWTAPTLLPESIQQEGFTYTQPSIGRHEDDGKEYLYYVSDQENGSQGKLDIWVAEVMEDGSFGAPENLSDINTQENEVTPFFHTPTQTLYYSTEGKLGLGGFDVHKTRKQNDSWTTSENMGKPINSSLNDISFTLNEKGDKGYFASNRKGSQFLDKEFELCCDDLYKAEFDIKVELLVNTFDNISRLMLEGVTVRLLEMQEDDNITEIAKLTNPEGKDFVFYADRGKKYMLEATRPGYVQQMEELNIAIDAPDQISQEIYLNPIVVDLQALTYDMDTEEPLAGVTVQIIEVKPDGSEEVVQEQFNDFGNDFKFPLEINKIYLIRASKSGYKPLEALQLSTNDLQQPETFLAELYLKRTSFGDYLPLDLYFDNDYPDQDSRSSSTNTNYAATVDDYYDRQSEYKTFYTGPMDEEAAYLMKERYDAFFDREVQTGYETLKEFAIALEPFLERGNEITLNLKGYASPRAGTAYNLSLSSRRIMSIENFFRSYEGGLFIPYIEGGQLSFERSPFGEQRTNFFQDLLEDERESIYSLGASLERRVEVEEVEVRLSDEDSQAKSFSSKGAEKR
ncbi:MAG: hypothetical protein AAGI23_22635 [Bacteroidota bacterium]